MKSLQNKVAAVTGAGSGIGRALARELAGRGCHLSLSDIDEEGLGETTRQVEGRGVKVSAQRLDVADREAVAGWAGAVVREHGRVNLLINNAGVALAGPVGALEISDYEWIMGINFWGVVYGTKAFLPHLEASGEGHIVNISSVFGLTAQPTMSGYNASKYAVRGFTESLRQDLELAGSCVSATCIHPGGVKTNIARSARISDSIEALTGKTKQAIASEFERSFITRPEDAARVIVEAVLQNRRRALVGTDARVYDLMVRLAPASYQRVITALFRMRKKPT